MTEQSDKSKTMHWSIIKDKKINSNFPVCLLWICNIYYIDEKYINKSYIRKDYLNFEIHEEVKWLLQLDEIQKLLDIIISNRLIRKFQIELIL